MKRTTIAPAITRVHKLFRLRTIVNGLSKYSKGGTTNHIGKILVNTKLSKKSILESGNKLKRAREHAANAAYLGLLIPVRDGNKFRYITSPIGHLLGKYEFDDACPKNANETSIFIDRMMRLKLTNAYDSRNTYAKFHTRPFLSLLAILKHQALHINQIHYLLGIKDDFAMNISMTKQLLKLFSKYSFDDSSIKLFDRKFGLTDKLTREEIGRSTKPLLDWCLQGGLISVDTNYWCRIKENGVIALNQYSDYLPLWYEQFGEQKELATAVLMLYSLANLMRKKVDFQSLDGESKEIIRELQKKYSLFGKNFSALARKIDFDFHYDVPVKARSEVLDVFQNILPSTIIKKPSSEDLPRLLANVSFDPIFQFENKLKQSSSEREYLNLQKAIGIEVPRREWFQTDFEWQTCMRLRILNFSVFPYKGEFEGISDLPMATDNPDMVVRNDIKSLVECKSKAEWGEVLKFGKRIGGELSMYQLYTNDVRANSALFVCEAEEIDDDEFLSPFSKAPLSKIVIVTWKFLDECRRKIRLREQLEETIKEPTNLSPEERVLII